MSGSTSLRVAAVGGALVVTFLVERIITGGAVIDLTQVDWGTPGERIAAAVLIVGSLLVAGLAAIGARGWRRAVAAWCGGTLVAGLVYLSGGHESALVMVSIACGVGLMAIVTSRSAR